ncbi:hypothetical protein [Aureimonas jatrophae]|uniref:Uncharacterized protein n=1 Tax=Aureimonas jatrophae TaxID=1166073 RepID=A0A1H0MCT8_9HYPH|nr:hypothetical protein [Aureimonas jatrophae]MBB3951122.1 hypothetical protein [Aureimonas jatrophae]SDO78135.1 hypothetical protein SAMN05192530_11340 [Aureimonas jatrophae]
MIRLPSSFALAAWSGFHAVTALTQIAASSGREMLYGVPLDPPAATGPEQGLLITLSMVAATIPAAALVFIHSKREETVRRGEGLAYVGLGLSFAFVMAALLFGAPFSSIVSRPDLAFWSLGLTALALAFDGCMFGIDEPEDEMELRKALVAINASIPRQPRGDDLSRSTDEVR